MDIILLQSVNNLGHEGKIVKVRPGYAKNFLFKKRKAVAATKKNIDLFLQKEKDMTLKYTEKKDTALKNASLVKGAVLRYLGVVSDSGQLYGSLLKKDIIKLVLELNLLGDIPELVLPHKIKQVGVFNITLVFHPEVKATVTLVVARNSKEAETLLQGVNNMHKK